MCPYSEFFWSVFSHIRTEYRDSQSRAYWCYESPEGFNRTVSWWFMPYTSKKALCIWVSACWLKIFYSLCDSGLSKSFNKWRMVSQNKKKKENIKRHAHTTFFVRGILIENHLANVSAFSNILKKCKLVFCRIFYIRGRNPTILVKQKCGSSYFSILHPNNHSKHTYSCFKTVRLVKR